MEYGYPMSCIDNVPYIFGVQISSNKDWITEGIVLFLVLYKCIVNL